MRPCVRRASTFVRCVKHFEALKQGRPAESGPSRHVLFVDRRPVLKQCRDGSIMMRPVFFHEHEITAHAPSSPRVLLSVGTTSTPLVTPATPPTTEPLVPYYATGVKLTRHSDDATMTHRDANDATTRHGVDVDDYVQGLRDGAVAVDLRMAMFVTEQPELLSKAQSLLQWRNTFKHCPRCRDPLTHGPSNATASCACGSSFYPTVSPCIITLISDAAHEHLLLVRQPRSLHGMFTCVAGFAEPGESLESSVFREVAEEVGVVATQVRYVHHSQHWPFPQGSLMTGFLATADMNHEIDIDTHELQDARWFTRDQVQQAADRSTLQRLTTRSSRRRTPVGTGDSVRGQGGHDFDHIPPPGTASNRLILAWLEGKL